MQYFTIQAEDGFPLACAGTEPNTAPKALVQLIHGAVEHKERYFDFMEFLCQRGYAVFMTDNRGNGASVSEDYPLGHMGTLEQMISDQFAVTQAMKARCPGVPVYLFGHSLGSAFARIYLQQHDDAIQKLVLSGTMAHIPCAGSIVPISKALAVLTKGKAPSHRLGKLFSIGGAEWISANQENLARYRADPLCQFTYDDPSLLMIAQADAALYAVSRYQCKNPALPILSVSGENDPCTGGKIGLTDTVRTLRRIGYQQVKCRVYAKMRHEVLNETDRLTVYHDILNFLEA